MRTAHGIDPVFDENSKILILGSFPSVKSREMGFFYGHPQNRFWKLLSSLFAEDIPESIEEKKSLLLKHGVALWDVIAECDILGSSDSSIKNVIPNDICRILSEYKVERLFANGKTAEKLYNRYIFPKTGIKITVLPSTSPANAAWSMEKLASVWGAAFKEE